MEATYKIYIYGNDKSDVLHEVAVACAACVPLSHRNKATIKRVLYSLRPPPCNDSTLQSGTTCGWTSGDTLSFSLAPSGCDLGLGTCLL